MSNISNIEINLQKLAEIKRGQPKATHVYFRRVGKDGLIVDIPIEQAEFTIRQWPLWEITASNKDMDEAVEQSIIDAPEPPVEVPPKPSESEKNVGKVNPYQKKQPQVGRLSRKKLGRPKKRA
jgi:hypothetical protein